MCTCPILCHRESLNEAAVVMTWGNWVAPGNAPPNLVPGPTFDTPWRASDHHSYPKIPSLRTGAALFTNNPTFSCNVSLPIKSLTLSPTRSDTLQKGKFFVMPLLGSQANGGRDSPPVMAYTHTRIKMKRYTSDLRCILSEEKKKMFAINFMCWRNI